MTGTGFFSGLASGLKQGSKDDEEEGGSNLSRALKRVFKRKVSDVSESGGAGPGFTESGFRKGGRVPKTGRILAHKGEVVIPAEMVKRIEGRKATRKTSRRTSRR